MLLLRIAPDAGLSIVAGDEPETEPITRDAVSWWLREPLVA
jgi:hypothetical protein